MIHPVYTEIIKLIMKKINEFKGYGTSVYSYTGSIINPQVEIPKIPGLIEFDYSNPFKISGFEGFDYHLMYNDQDEFIGFTSHNGKIEYYLRKDIYDDLIYVDVITPDISFKIALIFQFYDLRHDTEYVEEKGLLTDVILLNANNESLITEIQISPESQEAEFGETVNFTCNAVLFNGNTIDVTDVVKWTIGSPLTIYEGEVEANYSGRYTVTATYQNLIDSAILIVENIELIVKPENSIINPGQSVQYFAYVKKNDKLTLLDSQLVEWSINSNVLNIDQDGLVTNTTEYGTYIVTVNHKNNTATATIEVKSPELYIDPNSIEINQGETAKFKAYLQLVGNVKDVTYKSTWEVDSPLLISNGKVSNTLEASGTYTITCRYDYNEVNLVAYARLVINEPELKIIPSSDKINIGEIAQFTAQYVTDNGNVDVTFDCNWDIESPLKIKNGKVYNTVESGTYTITAKHNGKTATATIEIKLADLRITPSRSEIKIGETVQLHAVLELSSGDVDVTDNSKTNWEIESPLKIKDGLVTNTIKEGTYTVTAEYEELSDTAKVIISPFDFEIVPQEQTISIGETAEFDAIYDGRVVTNYCDWDVNLSPLQISRGRVTNTQVSGDALITAEYNGIRAHAVLHIEEAELKIVPEQQSVELGQKTSVKYKAFLETGSSDIEVTDKCSWKIDSPLEIKDGVVTNISKLGTYTIRATYNGVTARATLIVTEKNIEVDTQTVIIWFKDGGSLIDGDSIRVKLNGKVLISRLDLEGDWKPITLELEPGVNELELGACYNGRYLLPGQKGGACTATIKLTDENENIIQDDLNLFISCPTTPDGKPVNPDVYYKIWTFVLS